jgi:hypothetical protein
MSQHLVQRVFQLDLKMFPYKISVVYKLSDSNEERLLQFAALAEGKDNILFQHMAFR